MAQSTPSPTPPLYTFQRIPTRTMTPPSRRQSILLSLLSIFLFAHDNASAFHVPSSHLASTKSSPRTQSSPSPSLRRSSSTSIPLVLVLRSTTEDQQEISIEDHAAPLFEIDRRRNLAIISHPDSGKTTMTEKLLLYGGALQQAGAVRMKGGQRGTASDFMEMEKERGISIR